MARLLTIHILEDGDSKRGSVSFSDAIASRKLTAEQAAVIWQTVCGSTRSRAEDAG